jgi:hypothetical protein
VRGGEVRRGRGGEEGKGRRGEGVTVRERERE